jgi:hypothetical protein
MTQKINRYIIFLTMMVAGIGLAAFAYLGLYNRYWADDWCYNTDFKHQGVLTAVGNYFATGDEAHRGYSTNRYSLTLFSGLLYLFGISGTQVLASLTILLWLGGLIWIAHNLNQAKHSTSDSILLLSSGLLLFYTLYLSPQRFQILYWRSGVLPYSWTILFGLLILGFITSQLVRERPAKIINYAIAPVAFLGGGFSEIGCAFLFSGLTILVLSAWRAKRRLQNWALKIYSTSLTAWIFLLIAMITLILSPSNMRSGALATSNLFLVPIFSARYAINFTLYSFVGSPFPHIVLFTTFVGLGYLSRQIIPMGHEIKKPSRVVLATLLVTFLLVSSIQAPTAYFYGTPPDPRGQSLSRFVILTGLAMVAWVFGITALTKFSRTLGLLPPILLLMCCLYTFRATLNIYKELPGFVERAQLWDNRDAQIESSIAQGATQIEISAIDTNQINTRDIIRSRDFGEWVTNACGVKYYDAEALKVAP